MLVLAPTAFAILLGVDFLGKIHSEASYNAENILTVAIGEESCRGTGMGEKGKGIKKYKL